MLVGNANLMINDSAVNKIAFSIYQLLPTIDINYKKNKIINGVYKYRRLKDMYKIMPKR